jgi:thymidylate synthase
VKTEQVNVPTKELRQAEGSFYDLKEKAIAKLKDGQKLGWFEYGDILGKFQYEKSLLETLLKSTPKFDRTGTGTLGIHGHQSRFNLDDGFPLITSKKVNPEMIIHELLWMMRGETNIKYLVDNNVNIWTDWPFKNWWQHQNPDLKFPKKGTDQWKEMGMDDSLKGFEQQIKNDSNFAKQWGELGPVYGKQWRSWEYWTVYEGDIKKNNPNLGMQVFEDSAHKRAVDQIQEVVNAINNQHKTGVISRRMIVSAWNAAQIKDMEKSGLPPCHCLFQFHSRLMTLKERKDYYEKTSGLDWAVVEILNDDDLDEVNVPVYELDLQLYQRSCDIFLGVPYNIASYAMLLMMMAQVTNCKPGTFIHDYGDLHIYTNHMDQITEQLSREPFVYPTLKLINRGQKIDEFRPDDFVIEDYKHHKFIKGAVAI